MQKRISKRNETSRRNEIPQGTWRELWVLHFIFRNFRSFAIFSKSFCESRK